ncbi:unnamed protein product [Anisakis simplex]|uniref:UDP-N-acetylglucosamine/UDP-glucose/GDP-mannose transporter n=1 Tax=Anisakis simplex TaxID=6269 RepID=A0A0M3J575_ANISI|nr:unnamed protein product [Anisakis simplex]
MIDSEASRHLVQCRRTLITGVYLEKMLKQSDVNIWMQNIRLSLISIPISAVSVLLNDHNRIAEGNTFRGFDTLVWILTFTNSLGGLLISIVIKYADNILKAYAQSAAIIGAAIGSWILFDFVPNLMFTLGAGTVLLSVYIYSAYPFNGYERQIHVHSSIPKKNIEGNVESRSANNG